MIHFDFKNIPGKTGIYQFKDERGKVLYVGKAKNLRNRMRSYARPGKDSRERIIYLMEEAVDYEFFLTATEKEALLLENNLIKKHRPTYNVYFRDDKDYLCVRIDLKSDFPRFQLVRKVSKDGALYFGPFSSAKKIRDLLRITGKLFPMRTCTESSFSRRKRPCMQYQIKRCHAPCVGFIGREDYREIVEQAVSFFKGDFKSFSRKLKKDMEDCSRKLMFEDAARIRDKLKTIDSLAATQSVVNARLPDSDIFGIHVEDGRAAVSVMFLRNMRIMDVRSFMLSARCVDREELIGSLLSQYYDVGAYLPDEIIIPMIPSDSLVRRHLESKIGRKGSIKVPRRGKKRDLIMLAEKNAISYFEAKRSRELKYEELMNQMYDLCKLKNYPYRIECYDVSHHGGKNPVGSMVLFEHGAPVKEGYRKFKIRNVEGIDDYAMLSELLERRLGKGEDLGRIPDLIILDGGKGQLHAGMNVASRYPFSTDMIAIAKEKGPGNKGEDRVYIAGRKNPLKLKAGHPVINYLKQVRDEAHRFAISYQRRRDEKELLNSAITSFPGMGKIRFQRLISTFGSVRGVMKSSPGEISSLLGISRGRSESFLAFLRETFPDMKG